MFSLLTPMKTRHPRNPLTVDRQDFDGDVVEAFVEFCNLVLSGENRPATLAAPLGWIGAAQRERARALGAPQGILDQLLQLDPEHEIAADAPLLRKKVISWVNEFRTVEQGGCTESFRESLQKLAFYTRLHAVPVVGKASRVDGDGWPVQKPSWNTFPVTIPMLCGISAVAIYAVSIINDPARGVSVRHCPYGWPSTKPHLFVANSARAKFCGLEHANRFRAAEGMRRLRATRRAKLSKKAARAKR